MNRRTANRLGLTVERPRQKGWWGAPGDDELEPEAEEPRAPRETPRRTPQSQPRAVTQVGRALTPNQIEAIRAVMRTFIEDDTARGIDPRCTLVCQRCAAPRRAIGSIRYERFTLCNDCSVEYEVARARGLMDSVAEFLERSVAASA